MVAGCSELLIFDDPALSVFWQPYRERIVTQREAKILDFGVAKKSEAPTAGASAGPMPSQSAFPNNR
jgi:hypothetical protein